MRPSETDTHGARPRALGLAFVLGSALLYAAAFPPLGLSGLMWVALVPFFAIASRSGPLAGAGYGLAWGVVACWGVSSWLPGMLADFFDLNTTTALGAFVVIAVGLAGVWYAAFGAWLGWLGRRGPTPALLVALGWGTCEYARATALLPTPWALSAYSQTGSPALLQSADLAGPFGLGIAIGLVNAALAGLVGSVPRWRPAAPGLVLAVVVLAAMSGYGHWRLAQRFDEGPAFDVALVQGAIVREHRFERAYREANLSRHLELSREAAASDPALIVWPEFAVDFYLREPSVLQARVREQSRATRASLLVGAPDYRLGRSGVTEYTNSVFLFDRGRLRERYDKVRLMPFSETNPLRAVTRIGSDRYTPGRELRPVETSVGPVGVMLCSEAMLPGHVRSLVDAGSLLLANPSNDGWFDDPSAARMQLDAVVFRAVESRRTVVRPAASGYTAVIDPHGYVRAEAPYNEPAWLSASVHTSTARSPYHRSGEAVPLCAAGVAALWTLPAVRRRPIRR